MAITKRAIARHPSLRDGRCRRIEALGAMRSSPSGDGGPLGNLATRSTHVLRAISPDGDGDRQCERRDHKAKVEPGPISLGVLGKNEKMDHHPHAYGEPQSKPDQIAGSLVYGRNGFALGHADARSDGHQRPDEHRAQNDGQYSQPHRDGRCRRPDVEWTWLPRFGAHGLYSAPIAIPPFRTRARIQVRIIHPTTRELKVWPNRRA